MCPPSSSLSPIQSLPQIWSLMFPSPLVLSPQSTHEISYTNESCSLLWLTPHQPSPQAKWVKIHLNSDTLQRSQLTHTLGLRPLVNSGVCVPNSGWHSKVTVCPILFSGEFIRNVGIRMRKLMKIELSSKTLWVQNEDAPTPLSCQACRNPRQHRDPSHCVISVVSGSGYN